MMMMMIDDDDDDDDNIFINVDSFSLSSSGNKVHGTMMAGLAGATGGNGVCGVGVAFKASLSGTFGIFSFE